MQNNIIEERTKNPGYLKYLLIIVLFLSVIYFTVSYYFGEVLNKSSISFSSANGFEKRSNGNQILLRDGSITLNWDGIRYYFEADVKSKCSSSDSIFLYFFSDSKPSKNCFKKGTEEFILFEKIINVAPIKEIRDLITESEEITSERKKKILNNISNDGDDLNEGIFYNLNEDNYKILYSKSFIDRSLPFLNILNRINILLFKNNYIEAVRIIKQVLEFPKEQIIFYLNELYFNHPKYEAYFYFYKKLKESLELHKGFDGVSLIKEYFDLFLDKYVAWGNLKVGRENVQPMINEALGCSSLEKNLLSRRKCLQIGLTKNINSKFIVFQLLRIGDDSYDNLWAIKN